MGRLMRIMTGLASLFQRRMDIFFLKIPLLMAGKAGCFHSFFQELRIVGIVRVMTVIALSLGDGGMGGFLIRAGTDGLMAGVAEFRRILAKKNAAHKPVGQVTLVTAFILYRGMHVAF